MRRILHRLSAWLGGRSMRRQLEGSMRRLAALDRGRRPSPPFTVNWLERRDFVTPPDQPPLVDHYFDCDVLPMREQS